MSSLNPAKTEITLQQGARLWAAQSNEAPELRDVIWHLIGEAAETMRALPTPRPGSFGSGWPEIVHDSAEIEQAQNEIFTERREAAEEERQPNDLYTPSDNLRPAISSAQAERFDQVTIWLRFVETDGMRSTNRSALYQRLMLALAGGMSARKAIEDPRFKALALHSRQAVHNFKKRSLERIEVEIRTVCPKINVGIYANQTGSLTWPAA